MNDAVGWSPDSVKIPQNITMLPRTIETLAANAFHHCPVLLITESANISVYPNRCQLSPQIGHGETI
jgi:hypothetical protein